MAFGASMIVGRAKSINDGCGYLINDNRASGGNLEEADVLACNHCQKLLVGKDWRDNGGWCGQCGQPMCAECADLFLKPPDEGGGCVPFIKIVEENLDKAYHAKQRAKLLGI